MLYVVCETVLLSIVICEAVVEVALVLQIHRLGILSEIISKKYVHIVVDSFELHYVLPDVNASLAGWQQGVRMLFFGVSLCWTSLVLASPALAMPFFTRKKG